MKLLFDENLSSIRCLMYIPIRRMFTSVVSVAPPTSRLGVRQSTRLDHRSKDSDFEARSVFLGAPPKFIWIRSRNRATEQVEKLLRTTFTTVKRFVEEDDEACLILDSHGASK